MTPPVTTPVCDVASGAENRGSACVINHGGKKQEKQQDKEEGEEEMEPRECNPAAAPTPHKTARERARETAAAAGGRTKATPVTASTRAGNAAEEGARAMFPAEPEERAERGAGEPRPDVAASHRTVRGGLIGAGGKVEGVSGSLGAEGAAPLEEAVMACSSSSVPGVGAPGGVLDEAAFDAAASANNWELPSVAEPRTLPRKVSLRFVPRDQATKDRVAERGYLPFQKLTAPVSGVL